MIRDHIILRKEVKAGTEWQAVEEKVVLAPSTTSDEWDSVHVCDPFVIGGDYHYKNTDYYYAMLYLGCNTLDNSKNEIGIAFAKEPEGPWVKYENNPIITRVLIRKQFQKLRLWHLSDGVGKRDNGYSVKAEYPLFFCRCIEAIDLFIFFVYN